MASLGTAVSLLLSADVVWRGASYHLMPANLLSPARWLATATPGCRSRPTPMAPAMLTWALLYPAGCILSVLKRLYVLFAIEVATR